MISVACSKRHNHWQSLVVRCLIVGKLCGFHELSVKVIKVRDDILAYLKMSLLCYPLAPHHVYDIAIPTAQFITFLWRQVFETGQIFGVQCIKIEMEGT